MKKLISLFVLLISSTAFSQANQQTNSRIRDATNPALVAAVGAGSATITAATIGLTTRSLNYHWNGTNWVRLNPPWGTVVDSYTGGGVALNVAAQNFVLPVSGIWYCMTAQGGSACITCGGGAPPTTNMTTHCTFLVPEGSTRCEILTGPNCGVISPSTVAGGYLRFTYRQ